MGLWLMTTLAFVCLSLCLQGSSSLALPAILILSLPLLLLRLLLLATRPPSLPPSLPRLARLALACARWVPSSVVGLVAVDVRGRCLRALPALSLGRGRETGSVDMVLCRSTDAPFFAHRWTLEERQCHGMAIIRALAWRVPHSDRSTPPLPPPQTDEPMPMLGRPQMDPRST